MTAAVGILTRNARLVRSASLRKGGKLRAVKHFSSAQPPVLNSWVFVRRAGGFGARPALVTAVKLGGRSGGSVSVVYPRERYVAEGQQSSILEHDRVVAFARLRPFRGSAERASDLERQLLVTVRSTARAEQLAQMQNEEVHEEVQVDGAEGSVEEFEDACEGNDEDADADGWSCEDELMVEAEVAPCTPLRARARERSRSRSRSRKPEAGARMCHQAPPSEKKSSFETLVLQAFKEEGPAAHAPLRVLVARLCAITARELAAGTTSYHAFPSFQSVLQGLHVMRDAGNLFVMDDLVFRLA
eukprot:TRINITY_DN47658_c0_g1_i1.p1 TRINITY_DN47658_c0_g1~~TRINITY_DN47658_c0_g1_i1.p1  ORF type:complete len:301 (-),score=33.12 TRINITY_DN47658_c0_g1_i1:151-1053(-)